MNTNNLYFQNYRDLKILSVFLNFLLSRDIRAKLLVRLYYIALNILQYLHYISN